MGTRGFEDGATAEEAATWDGCSELGAGATAWGGGVGLDVCRRRRRPRRGAAVGDPAACGGAGGACGVRRGVGRRPRRWAAAEEPAATEDGRGEGRRLGVRR